MNLKPKVRPFKLLRSRSAARRRFSITRWLISLRGPRHRATQCPFICFLCVVFKKKAVLPPHYQTKCVMLQTQSLNKDILLGETVPRVWCIRLQYMRCVPSTEHAIEPHRRPLDVYGFNQIALFSFLVYPISPFSLNPTPRYCTVQEEYPVFGLA